MGGSNGSSGDNISDVNFFQTQRSDIPNPTQPSNIQREAYNDYQPAAPGRGGSAQFDNPQARYVTVRDGQNIIYAEPGSTVIIDESGRRQVGGGQNGFYPDYNDTMRQLQERRMAQMEMQNGYRQPYYGNQNQFGYQNVNGGGWEVPRPYMPMQNNGFFGIHIGGRHSGFSIGFGTPNYNNYNYNNQAWNYQPQVNPASYYNYANNGGYYNSSYYGVPQYGYGNNTGLALNFNIGGGRRRWA